MKTENKHWTLKKKKSKDKSTKRTTLSMKIENINGDWSKTEEESRRKRIPS